VEDYGGLDWIPKSFDLGFGLLLVRGLAPAAVLERLKVPGHDQVLLTAADAYSRANWPQTSGVRAGSAEDGWTFIVGDDATCTHDHYVQAVSRSTEAVAVSYTGNSMAWFKHARDGHILSSFEPGMDDALDGGPGHQITAPMRAILTAGNANRLGLALILLRDAFGIRIPPHDSGEPLLGGLITVRR
jgi:hypothetical protein